MPTRLLREAILDSERVCSLSFPAEVFYRRLMSVVDDFGRFDGRLSVLRSRLYPLQIEKVREADIERWIAECVKAGLIVLYSVSAKPYLLFRNLGDPRAKESKYPAPPSESERKHPRASENICAQTETDANGCKQTRADVPYSYSDSDALSVPSELTAAGAAEGVGSTAPSIPPSDPPPKRSRKEPSGSHHGAIRDFCDRWAAKYAAKYPFNAGKDAAAVKWMLGQVDGDPGRLAGVFERFFAESDPFYAAGDRHSLAKLRQHFARWLVGTPTATSPRVFNRADAEVEQLASYAQDAFGGPA